MSEGRRATDRERLSERVAVLEDREASDRLELERARLAIHELRGERAGIAHLAAELGRLVAELARTRDELRAEFAAIAAAAAGSALTAWERDRRDEGSEHRDRVKLALQGLAVALTTATATAALIVGLR